MCPARGRPNGAINKICYNWEIKPEKVDLLARLMSFEDHRIVASKAWDNAVMRKKGEVMVAIIPPFLVEHKEDKDDTMKLVISFHTLEMNSRGVISWPPKNCYSTQEEYQMVEKHAWRLMYRCWINLPHGGRKGGGKTVWHTMSWRFLRLARRAHRAGLTVSDDEELSDEGSSSPDEMSSAEEHDEQQGQE